MQNRPLIPNLFQQGLQHQFRQLAGPDSVSFISANDLALLQANGITPAAIKRTYQYQLFDRHRYVAGTVVPSTPITFFARKPGDTASVDNATATTYTVQLNDTNMVAGQQLGAGAYFIAKTLEAKIEFTGAAATTITAGEQLNPTPAAPGASYGSVNPSSTLNLIEAQYGGTIRLNIQQTDYESGPLFCFPSQFGMLGWAGAGTTNNNESIAQNSLGSPRRLMPWHLIRELITFNVQLTWNDAWTPRNDFYLTVLMDGTYFTTAR